MTTINTNDLIGLALDWAVELAKGTHWSPNGYFVFKHPDGTTRIFERNPEWRYSTHWAQSGPIIDREKISVRSTPVSSGIVWFATYNPDNDYAFCGDGPTLLIAAMRCFCASKLGDTVEVPEELA